MAKKKVDDKREKLALDGDAAGLVDDKKDLHADKELVTDILIPDSDALEFICPNCGKISQNDVIFLCNTCENSELIHQDGVYMCPQCLYPGDNFECMKCENKHVRMKHKK